MFSFNFDTTGLFNSASQIFNGLWPVVGLMAGLGLGGSILRFVSQQVQNVF